MQIAQQHVIAGMLELRNGFLNGRGAIHTQALSRKAFLEKRSQAFLVIEDQHSLTFKRFGSGSKGSGGNTTNIGRSRQHFRHLRRADREMNRESGTSSRQRFCLDVPAMLTN